MPVKKSGNLSHCAKYIFNSIIFNLASNKNMGAIILLIFYTFSFPVLSGSPGMSVEEFLVLIDSCCNLYAKYNIRSYYLL